MKKVLCSLITCLLLWLPIQLKATHIMGSDIQWQCLGSDSFKIIITIYRDCNGVELWNDALSIKGINCNYNYSERPYLSPPLDITPTCSKTCSRCSSPACGFPYGIQKIMMTRIVDLSHVNCCQLEINWGQNARNELITTGMAGQRFHIKAMMDKCKAPCNNSPVFTNAPVTITCLGQCLIYNQGVTDAEGDSLVYSFTPPLTSEHDLGSYYPPYSYQKPILFNGFPNSNLPFDEIACEGFHLDRENGDLKFKPMALQVTVMAIKVEEFRKGTKIGEVRRDIQLIVLQCPPNKTPVLSGINGTSNYTAYACPGQPLCFNILSQDENMNDSLIMEWNEGIPGASFTPTNSKRPVGQFCWTPDESHARPMPYYFIVKLKDNACPLVGATSRAYGVIVRPLPSAEYKINDGPCGKYSLEVLNRKPQNATVEWEIENYSKPYNANASKINLELEEGREYPFKLRVTSDCIKVYRDTIRTLYSTILNNHKGEICRNDTISIDADLPAERHCRWVNSRNGQVVSQAGLLVVSPDSTTIYRLEITDTIAGEACHSADTFRVVVNQLPALTVKSLPARCLNSTILMLNAYATPTSALWAGPGVLNNRFNASAAGTGTHWLKVQTTSPATGCTKTDSAQIKVHDLPPVTGTPDFELCITDEGKALTGLPLGGSWTGIGISQAQDGSFNFKPQEAGAGKFTLGYHVADSNGCINHHILEAAVFEMPEVDFNVPANLCEEAESVVLKGIPSGGVFAGTGVQDSFFTPAAPGFYEVLYRYTGKGGCLDSISKKIEVNAKTPAKATIAGGADKFCVSAAHVVLQGLPAGGHWSGNGVEANVFLPPVAGVGLHWLTYVYENAQHCQSVDSMQVAVLPAPQLTLQARENVCADEEILLDAHTLNIERLRWETSGSGSFALSGQFSSSYKPSPEDIASGSVVLVAKSADTNACPVVTDQSTVAIHPVPEVDFTSNVDVGCSSPLEVKFSSRTTIASGRISEYEWNFGNGKSSPDQDPVILYENPGLYTIRLNAISDHSCSSSLVKRQFIRVKLAPIALFEADPNMTSISFPKINFINNSINTIGPEYEWNFGDAAIAGGGSSNEINPEHTYSDTGEYIIQLIVNNQNECVDTVFNKIYIHPDMLVYIPNIFSPNAVGPAQNEKFKPAVYGTSDYLFQVYDRWGEKLFETHNPEDGWDGTYNGELCPENALVYILIVKDMQGKRYRYTGTVTMIR